jgi:hypothetical protein
MDYRTIDLYELLCEESCLSESAMQHLSKSREFLKGFGYEFKLVQVSKWPEDYGFNVSHKEVAAMAFQLIIPLMRSEDINPVNILSVLRCVEESESKWQEDNLPHLTTQHLRSC